MVNITEKAEKSKLTQEELSKIVEGKRLNGDSMAVAYDKALHSDKAYYDLSNIADPAERKQAIEAASGDNAAIYLEMKKAYDAKMELVRKKVE